MKLRAVHPTPNPNAFKFVLAEKVVAQGVRNYTGADEARGDELATTLFAIDGVDTVFLCGDFVTVSMAPSADWRAVHDQVIQVLEAAPSRVAAQPAPAADGGDPAATEPGVVASDPALLARINDLLDDRVRPALAGDGGGLQVLGLEGKTLQIRYQGACGSCPSSIAGTLHAIQNLIQSEIDEGVQVVSV